MVPLLRRLAVLLAVPAVAGAQSAPRTLTLDEAFALAKRNNPGYQQAQNALARSAAQRRATYGALLPSVNTSFDVGLREGRQQFFAGVPFGAANNILSSSGGLNAGISIAPGLGFGLAAANRSFDAAEEETSLGEMQLKRDITVQFMNALQARARVSLQDTLLASARTQLDLTRARARAGLATDLDVRRSEVAVGQQEVQLLQAQSTADVEVFRLFQVIGVTPESSVQLRGDLPVTEPPADIAALQARAVRASPELRARRARLEAARETHLAQRTTYLPTLSLNASVSGVTQRFQGALPPGTNLTGTGSFPFDFVRQPYNVGASLSLPLFNGFQREQNIAVAAAGRRDAEAQLRQTELSVATTVVSQATILKADYRAVEINRANLSAAREALTLAEERYRLGLANLVDLVQVRADLERASNDYINSVYTYHRDFAQLEAVTGPLR